MIAVYGYLLGLVVPQQIAVNSYQRNYDRVGLLVPVVPQVFQQQILGLKDCGW